MSDVRTLLGPLFPDVTFTDADQAFVERRAVVVGAPGSASRAAVEKVWPAETFADDDVLVVETGRRGMTDTVVLPGELTADDFVGDAAAAVDPLIWQPSTRVTLDGLGRAVMPIDDPAANAGLRLIAQPPAAGKSWSANWAQLGAPANGYSVTGIRIARVSDPGNYYVQVRVSGGKILWQAYAFGGPPQAVATYDPAAHRSWRIRVADQVYVEVSADGQAWTQLGTLPLPAWTTEPCVYTVTAGPWDPRGNSSTPNLLDGVSLA